MGGIRAPGARRTLEWPPTSSTAGARVFSSGSWRSILSTLVGLLRVRPSSSSLHCPFLVQSDLVRSLAVIAVMLGWFG